MPSLIFVLRDILRHGRTRITDNAEAGALCGNHDGGGRRRLLKLLDLRGRQRAVERIGSRYSADQHQHDQAHAFLAVIRAVRKADAGAGRDQQATDPQRRRLIAFRGLVEEPDCAREP